jgi:hypothetical protein
VNLAGLERAVEKLSTESDFLTIENYVLSKPLIRKGESHAQCLIRLFGPNANTLPPKVMAHIERNREQAALINHDGEFE